MPDKTSKEIVGEIFGPNGLTNLDTSAAFVQKSAELETKYKDQIGSYLTDKLIPSIREYVHDVSKTDCRVPIN